MFKRLSQFNALDLKKISSSDKNVLEPNSLIGFLKNVQNSLLIIEKNTILTDFDELDILGVTRADIKSKLDKLCESVGAEKELDPLELILFGQLLGEFNALNRYAKYMIAQQNIIVKTKRRGKNKNKKTLAYLRTANELYQILLNLEVFTNFESWAVISAVDAFLRQHLATENIISEHKCTQKIAEHLNIDLNKGKRSTEQLKFRDEVLTYLNQQFSTKDCLNLHKSCIAGVCHEIEGFPVIKEDNIINFALRAAKKVVETKEFQTIKQQIGLEVLVEKLMQALTKKFEGVQNSVSG